MPATAILFTYRSIAGLTAAARGLGLPEVLLDVPHYGFVRVHDFGLRQRDDSNLPGVSAADVDLAYALDRWLVLRHLLETPWGALLRPDRSVGFCHGFMQSATLAELRAELEAGGYTVLEWADARAAMQPRRPASDSAAFLAAARLVAAATDPASEAVPDLPQQIDMNGPDDDEAIRVLAACGQLWRTRWTWSWVFDGDPDDAFRIAALARDGGVRESDWARFLAVAAVGRKHPAIELWLLAHVRELPEWLVRVCEPDDLPWIAERLRAYLADNDALIEPLNGLCADTARRLAALADASVEPPQPQCRTVARQNPGFDKRIVLLVLASPAHAAEAAGRLANLLPTVDGNALDGLIAVLRLVVDNPGMPPHWPDVAVGMRLLGWPIAADTTPRSLQRHLRARPAELCEALVTAARTHWSEIQQGVFGDLRFGDTDTGEVHEFTPDVESMLGELVDGRLPGVAERRVVGELLVTSGWLCVADPLAPARPALTRKVPRGRRPVEVVIDEHGQVGALIMHLQSGPITRWRLATCDERDEVDGPDRLTVEHGLAAVLDAAASEALAEIEDREAIIEAVLEDSCAAQLAVPGCEADAVVVRAPDGRYGAWWGVGGNGRLRVLVVDFGRFESSADALRHDAHTLEQLEGWVSRAAALLHEHLGPHGFGGLPPVVDRAAERIRVRVRREAVPEDRFTDRLELELAAGFNSDEHMTDAAVTLRALVADEWRTLDVPDLGVPVLASGPHAALAALDERLRRGVDALLAGLATA